MNTGQLPTNQLHGINWCALDHASHAPQLMPCKCCVVCVCVCVHICKHGTCTCMYVYVPHGCPTSIRIFNRMAGCITRRPVVQRTSSYITGQVDHPRGTYIFVGSCSATKVFVGNLPATGRRWVIIKPVMIGGQLPTNQ